MTPSRPSGDAIVDEVRDCLAAEFALTVSAEEPAVRELLEHQLDSTQDREKWRPLRNAIEAVGTIAPELRARLEAAIRTRFTAKLSPGAGESPSATGISLDTLSLVSEDEVQEEIAIGNAARRLREASGEAFYALNVRLAAVLGRDKLDEDDSPVHARVFARALLDVFSGAGTDSPARLAAFGAHDPAMLLALPKAYQAANAMLVKRGILPDLKRSYGRPQQVPGARASMHGMVSAQPAAEAAASAPSRSEPAAAPVQGIFDRLLASASAAPAAPLPAPAPAGLVTLHVRPELVEALRKLEARLDADPQAVSAATPTGPGAQAGPAVYSPEVVLRARDDMAGALTPTDTLVADLVAAMFGRLFVDPDVSDAAKVQLARLQLPVFKVVMTDRAFFTEPTHPIRGLIDAIAELGASEDAYHIEGKLPVEWLEDETQALLDAEHLDAAAFEVARARLAGVALHYHELLADNDSVVRTMRRDDAELSAVRDASLELAHRIAATECPQEAVNFAYHAWRPVLAHDHRTMGSGSERWKTDLETLDDLLWTLSPRATAAERERLEVLLPSVRFRLWQGLIRAQLTSEKIESLLDAMDLLHAELQRAPLAAAQRELANTVALGPVVAEDFTATLHISSDELGDEGVTRGAWFEFTEDDGTTRRARLAWVSPVQGACVFKDIARNRSFAISLADLRARRELGSARPVDGPGVALASIDGALEDVARERAA